MTEKEYMEMESNSIGFPVTYLPEWYHLELGDTPFFKIKVAAVNERNDRSGNLMAFLELDVGGGVLIDAVAFSSIYTANLSYLRKDSEIFVSGKKDSESKFVLKKISLTSE